MKYSIAFIAILAVAANLVAPASASNKKGGNKKNMQKLHKVGKKTSKSCVNKSLEFEVKLDGEVVTMVCDDVDSNEVCNAKLKKGKKRVKHQCPVSCEPFKKIKVGKKKNKETVLCGTMDTETMCEKKGVQKMCKNACGQCPTPTLAPTVSMNPSSAPSPAPTGSPTVDPTSAPTVDPTVSPTVDPTVSPTVDPTVSPTDAPTVTPTVTPTVAPTSAPTVAPTDAPTSAPTDAPTSSPTVAPTDAPTDAPTSSPTTSAPTGTPP